MNIAFVLMREVGVMLLIISLGVYTKKAGIFDSGIAKKLSDFLVTIVMPVMLIHTMQRDKIPELVPGFWVMLCLSLFVMSASAALSAFVFRRNDGPDRRKIDRLAVVLPNCGFMGIPLLLAAVGEDSLLYCAAMLGSFQLIMWGWGVPVIEGKKITLKRIFLNPSVVAFTAALILFMFEIRLPRVLLSFASQVSALNTPISMLMIGIFLADVNLRDVFLTPSIYKVVFWRNLVIPFSSVLIVYMLGLSAHFGKMLSLTFIIMISCSSAAAVILLPIRARVESSYAAQAITMGTLLSVITLPFVAFVAEKIL